MRTTQHPAESDGSPDVLGLAEEFVERLRQGERPSLREYAERFPYLAAEILDVFPAMALIENIAIDQRIEDLKDQPSGKTRLKTAHQITRVTVLSPTLISLVSYPAWDAADWGQCTSGCTREYDPEWRPLETQINQVDSHAESSGGLIGSWSIWQTVAMIGTRAPRRYPTTL